MKEKTGKRVVMRVRKELSGQTGMLAYITHVNAS